MKMIQKLLALILTLVMTAVLLPSFVLHANAAESVVTRDDGVWLFPVSSSYYNSFSDWAACPGYGTCAFHNTTHSQWGDNYHSSDPYGHNGIDIGVTRVDVYAAAPGTIIGTGSNSARGNWIVIEHPISGTSYSYYSFYQHLNQFYISSGEVSAGDVIAQSGNTGGGAYHLHFGIYRGVSGLGATTVLNNEWSSDWLRSESDQSGRVLVNPAASGGAGVPTCLGAFSSHCGSVRYTFNKNEVSIGGAATSIEYTNLDESTYYLKNNGTGNYLDDANAETGNGNNIQVKAFGGIGCTSQQMEIVCTDSEHLIYKMIVGCANGSVVNVYTGGAVTSGNNVTLWSSTDDNSQRWYFEKVEGGYVIRSAKNTSCVLTTNETNVIVQTYGKENPAQIWSIENAVAFDANGGEGAPGVQMKEYGEALTLSTVIPTREGYLFKGWATSSDATAAEYSAGGSYTTNANAVLYAVWDETKPELPAVDPDAVQIGFESEPVKAGDVVEVFVVLKNAPEIDSISVSGITYDESVLTLEDVEWVISGMTMSSYNPSNGKGVAAFNLKNVNGQILKLTFTVDANAADGEYGVSCTVSGKIVAETVKVATAPGAVTVKNYTVGDVTGDDLVTSADAIYILYHTFFAEDYPVNQDCDFNHDGVVSSADAIYVLYYTFFPEDYPLI